MAESQNTPKEQPTLEPGRMQLAEFRRQIYAVDVQRGVSPQDLLQPAFWMHFGAQLKPWDRIEARSEDGTWYARYIVLDSSRTWAKLALLSEHTNLGTGDVSMTAASDVEAKAVIDAYEVRHNATRKWHVVHRTKRSVLAEGMGLKEDAEAYLKQHALHMVGRAPAPTTPVTA